MALEAADVALFTNDLRCLAPIVQLARRARGKVLQNVVFAVVTKVCCLPRPPPFPPQCPNQFSHHPSNFHHTLVHGRSHKDHVVASFVTRTFHVLKLFQQVCLPRLT